MALIKLNQNTLELTVTIGVLESYEPSEKIKEIYQNSQELKKITTTKIKDLFGDKSVKDVKALLSDDKQINENWNLFLNQEYTPSLTNILNQVIEINKQICPGYKEFVEKA